MLAKDHENRVRLTYLTNVLNMGEGGKYARNGSGHKIPTAIKL